MKIICLSSSGTAKQVSLFPNIDKIRILLLPLKQILLTFIVLIMFLFWSPVAKAQISYIGSASATGTIITLPSGWSAGDMALVFAFRDGTAAYPTSPGFTEITRATYGGGTGDKSFCTLSYRLLQTGDGSFTFDNSTEIEVIVLHGTLTTNPVAKFAKTGSNNNNNMIYAGLTGTTQRSSWIIGFGGHRTATNVNTRNALPMTIRSASTATSLGMHSITDLISFSTTNWETVNTNSSWITVVTEVLEYSPPMYFQSHTSGDWSAIGTWEQSNDGITWGSATRLPNAGDYAVTILSGHTVYASSALSYNNLTIHGTYEHRMDGGTIPSATWDITSTCNVTGVIASTTLAGLNQTFGNFTWNCPNQTNKCSAITGGTTTINGDFTFTASGTGELRLIDNATLNVHGNFIINATTPTNILDLSRNSGATINLYGDWRHLSGTLKTFRAASVVFAKSGTQYFNRDITNVNAIDDKNLNINFTVNGGTTLQMYDANSVLTSNLSFTLSSGGTLGITSSLGITTSGSAGGNIQAGSRTYSTGANYIYDGTSAQNTGNGLPGTVSNLTFNNTGGIVTFNAICSITNNFSITNGSHAILNGFTHTTNVLTLGGVVQPLGLYGGTGSGAININPTYFESGTGTVNNAGLAGIWLGITDANWNNASNWSGGVPTSVTNAIISSYATNQPVISGEVTAVSNTVTINSGASLTVDPTGSATFTTLTNSGTINLESDANGIASLILTTYTDNNGTENIELSLTGGGNTWHYISSPVNGLPVVNTFFTDNTDLTWDLAQFVENIPTSLFDNIPYNLQLSWVGYDGWSYYNGSTTSYEFQSTGLQLGKGYNYWNEIEKTYALSGTINTSNPALALTFTDRGDGNEALEGFNLLGNPFTCGLDIQGMFDNAAWPSAINKAVYYTSNGSYYVYGNDVGVPTDQSQIPPMQGFFVQASASGTYSLPWVKVHTGEPRFKGEKASIPLVRLSISTNGKSEETVVRFNEKAKTGIDMEFDAPRFLSNPNTPSIYTSLDGIDYTINGLPFPETAVEIPVAVKLLTNDKYTITAMELQELGNYKVTLTDKLNNSSIDLKSVKEYKFSGSTGLINDRFVLTVTNLSTGIENPTLNDNSFNVYYGLDMINIQPLADVWDGKTGSVKVMDFSGNTVRNQQKTEFRKNTSIQLPSPGKTGLYFIEIRSGMMKYVGKVVIR